VCNLRYCRRPSISPKMVFTQTLRKGDRAMARDYDTSAYKKLLLHFMGESDPLYSMLQWLTERMMEVEL
ncbi:MAG TPA: hypothetical protein PL090_06740, partial [Syntrophales bacterium]|nr:hypothetical protein [Syntrophales bacterium]